MRVFLWDIDGTLVSTAGAGSRALGKAVRASVPATAALQRMKLDGMTDRKIARILCAAARHREQPDIPVEEHERAVTSAEIDHLLETYLAALQATPANEHAAFVVHPGVVSVLDALGPDRATHGLGTGNIEGGARAKLEPVGLWSRFPFGGFGSDAEERVDVLRAGWKKAEAWLGRALPPADVVVIGDTPRDIAAAHANGFSCVAVATGRHSIHELADSGGDLVLTSLAEPDAAERVFRCSRR